MQSPQSSAVTILGIDPGSQNMGWGIIAEVSGVLSLVDCGVIRPKAESFSDRLGVLFVELSKVMVRHKPTEAAIENVFIQKNVMTAMKLGQARGVAVAACAAHGVPVIDYEPTLIKKTLVGTGRAEKSQVSFMVGQMLGVKPDWAVDTGDALGCAICHLNMRRMARLTGGKR